MKNKLSPSWPSGTACDRDASREKKSFTYSGYQTNRGVEFCHLTCE